MNVDKTTGASAGLPLDAAHPWRSDEPTGRVEIPPEKESETVVNLFFRCN
jgi:hypothetical protein